MEVGCKLSQIVMEKSKFALCLLIVAHVTSIVIKDHETIVYIKPHGDAVLTCRFPPHLGIDRRILYSWVRFGDAAEDVKIVAHGHQASHGYSVSLFETSGVYDLYVQNMEFSNGHIKFVCQLQDADDDKELYESYKILMEMKAPSKPHILPQNMTVMSNRLLSLSCISFGIPAPILQWSLSKDDINMNHVLTTYMLNSSLTVYNFIVEGHHHQMIINCSSWNTLTSSDNMTTTSYVLKVQHSPGYARIEPEKQMIAKGDDTNLTCINEPPGYPEPEVRWWKLKSNKTLHTGIELNLNGVVEADEGYYCCQATNVFGEGSIGVAEVVVVVGPDITDDLELEVVTTAGDANICFTCSAKGNVGIRSWLTKDKIFLRTDDEESTIQTKFIYAGSGLTLVSTSYCIRKMELVNMGSYQCIFMNSVKTVESSSMILHVAHKPIILDKSGQGKLELNEGVQGNLSIKISSFPKPILEWYHNSTFILENSTHHQISLMEYSMDHYLATIYIEKLESEDFGEYNLKAINHLGIASATITVIKGPEDVSMQIQTSTAMPAIVAVTMKSGNETEKGKINKRTLKYLAKLLLERDVEYQRPTAKLTIKLKSIHPDMYIKVEVRVTADTDWCTHLRFLTKKLLIQFPLRVDGSIVHEVRVSVCLQVADGCGIPIVAKNITVEEEHTSSFWSVVLYIVFTFFVIGASLGTLAYFASDHLQDVLRQAHLQCLTMCSRASATRTPATSAPGVESHEIVCL